MNNESEQELLPQSLSWRQLNFPSQDSWSSSRIFLLGNGTIPSSMVQYAKPIMFRMIRRVSRMNTRMQWLRRFWISLSNILMLYYKYIAEHMGTCMMQVTLTLSTIAVI